jgi:DNA mismatch repair protein MutS
MSHSHELEHQPTAALKAASATAAHDVILTDVEWSAIGLLLSYVRFAHVGKTIHLRTLERLSSQSAMELDSITRRSLEITETLSTGERRGSLLSVLDKTVTNAGGRLLLSHVTAPLNSIAQINERLDFVEFFFNHPQLREQV